MENDIPSSLSLILVPKVYIIMVRNLTTICWTPNQCQTANSFNILIYKFVSPDLSTIRLMDGSTINEGRLEMLHDGQWGTVSSDALLSVAIVVCRMFG